MEQPEQRQNITGKEEEHLFKRTIKGGTWMVFLRILQQLLTIGKILVLARFLAPYEYGVFGICLIAIEGLNVFTQTGFNNALVQKQEDLYSHLDTAWTAGLIRSVGLFALLFLISPAVMTFFDGRPTFETRDLVHPEQFVRKLADQETPVAKYIFTQFDSTTQVALQNYSGDPEVRISLQPQLIDELNRLISNSALFKPSVFPQENYSAYLQRDMAHPAKIKDIERFNRRLLEESFPEIRSVILDCSGGSWLLRVMALSILLSGFQNIAMVAVTKELQFNKIFFQQLCGTCTDITVFIILAVTLRNAWALAIGQVAAAAALTIVGYLIHPYRPRWSLDFAKMSYLWAYGKWIFGIGILGFLILRTTDLFIGKLLGPAALGLYQMAFRIAFLPVRELGTIVGRVTFPGYAKIQHDLPRLQEAYYKVMRLTTRVTFPLLCIIGVLAYPITKLFFASAWTGMAPLIQVLFLMGLETAVFMNVVPLLQAINKHRVLFYSMSTRLILSVLLLYFVIGHFGIVGACWLFMILSAAVKTIVMPVLKRSIGLSYRRFLRQLLSPALATCLLAGCLVILQWALNPFLQPQPGASGWLKLLPYLILALIAGMGLTVYFLANWGLDSTFRKEIKELLGHLLKPFRM